LEGLLGGGQVPLVGLGRALVQGEDRFVLAARIDSRLEDVGA
jgi:hypothetical protein